jgi:AAA family ATP:ADP antiporter
MFSATIHKCLHWLGLSFDLDKQERNKIWWLTLAFFCVIGSYTVLKELKDLFFAQIVGGQFVYQVKLISMFLLLPATLLYAKLVDYLNRFWLLMVYSLLYGVAGLVIAYYLNDPVIGLANTTASYDRTFGWFIYLFYEGLVPFVISVFWAFANSITSPETAKKGYSLLIAGSKLGGASAAFVAYCMFTPTTFLGSFHFSSVLISQILLIGSSILLVVSPVIIYFLLQTSTSKNLQGYKAAHDYEQDQEKKGKSETGMFSGLTMLFSYPYILGIFGMMFFYELVNVVLGIQRIVLLQSFAKDAAEFSGAMFWNRVVIQGSGVIVAFLGTRILIKKLGEKICLMLFPILTGCLLIYLMVMYNEQAIILVFTLLGILNYAFAQPLREALYIPTVKDIRFKSKAWIESFGQRFAKACGSGAIGFIQKMAVIGTPAYIGLFSGFFALVIVLWTVVAYFLGRKYETVVKKGQVIGAE